MGLRAAEPFLCAIGIKSLDLSCHMQQPPDYCGGRCALQQRASPNPDRQTLLEPEVHLVGKRSTGALALVIAQSQTVPALILSVTF
jgi:hypothetical protein